MIQRFIMFVTFLGRIVALADEDQRQLREQLGQGQKKDGGGSKENLRVKKMSRVKKR